MRLGKNQVETLATLAVPTTAMIAPNAIARSLVKRGLLRVSDTGGFACITPAGLRTLADELEDGKIEGALEWAAREAAKNRKRYPPN